MRQQQAEAGGRPVASESQLFNPPPCPTTPLVSLTADSYGEGTEEGFRKSVQLAPDLTQG